MSLENQSVSLTEVPVEIVEVPEDVIENGLATEEERREKSVKILNDLSKQIASTKLMKRRLMEAMGHDYEEAPRKRDRPAETVTSQTMTSSEKIVSYNLTRAHKDYMAITRKYKTGDDIINKSFYQDHLPEVPGSLINFLVLIDIVWSRKLIVLLPLALNQVLIEAKKHWNISLMTWSRRLEKFIEQIDQNCKVQTQLDIELLIRKSYLKEHFVRDLLEDPFSTMFLLAEMEEEHVTQFRNTWNVITMEPSLSSPSIPTTSTSSTIAHTLVPSVDVPDYDNSSNTLQRLEDELFGGTSSATGTGSISSSISAKKNGQSITLKLEEQRGYNAVKLDLYPFNSIVSQAKQNWWKEATYRMTFLTQSAVDPLQIAVNKVIELAMHRMKADPKLIKEVKTIGSHPSYFNFQQPR